MENKNQTAPPLKVLMVPWLAHGHATPFFHLAKKLSKTNFQIFLCSTPIILNFLRQSQAKYFSHHSNTSIQLIDLQLPSTPELPPHHHTTKGLPRHLFSTLLKCYKMAGSSFAEIAKTVNPDLIVYDTFQTWAPEIALSRNIPAVNFVIVAAVTSSFFMHLYTYDAEKNFPFSNIFLPHTEMEKLRSQAESSGFTKFLEDLFAFSGRKMSSEIILINNWKEPEAKYMEYLSFLTGKRILSVGPILDQIHGNSDQDYEIMEWLDQKDPCSTLYAAFGTECALPKQDIQEIAHGLEHSKVNFIWVASFPEVGSIYEILPQGFEDRVKDRGLIVTKWAPQGKILGHSSTGGFLTHCGSSSTLEGIHFGVPLIALPVNVEQYIAAKHVVEIGIALEIERDGNGRLQSEEIAKVTREVVKEKIGEELREKSRELSKKIRIEEAKEIDEVVEELQKICLRKKHIS